jgi:hypothetical protein
VEEKSQLEEMRRSIGAARARVSSSRSGLQSVAGDGPAEPRAPRPQPEPELERELERAAEVTAALEPAAESDAAHEPAEPVRLASDPELVSATEPEPVSVAEPESVDEADPVVEPEPAEAAPAPSLLSRLRARLLAGSG